MHELIYRSIADRNITDVDITAILNTARTFNSENNITGCLLYHNKEFIQILEGDKKILKELYSRIEKDERHGFIRLLAEDTKEERLFKNWSMAYHELETNDLKNINKLLFAENITTIADLTEKPTRAIKLFWHMAKQLVKE